MTKAVVAETTVKVTKTQVKRKRAAPTPVVKQAMADEVQVDVKTVKRAKPAQKKEKKPREKKQPVAAPVAAANTEQTAKGDAPAAAARAVVEEAELPQAEQLSFMKLPGMKRLSSVAQIEKMSKQCYDELMKVSNNLLRNVVHKACILTEYSRKTTVGHDEILHALSLYNVNYYGGGSGSPEYFSVNKMPKLIKQSAKLRYYSNHSHQLYLARKPLVRHIKRVSEDIVTDYRFSPRAVDVLQELLERTLVQLLSSAHVVTRTRKSKTVQSGDIRAVLDIRAQTPGGDALLRNA